MQTIYTRFQITNKAKQVTGKKFGKISFLSILMLIISTGFFVNNSYGQCFTGENFNSAISVGTSQAPNTWYPDRYNSASFTSNVNFMGHQVLQESISAMDGEGSRPPAFNTSFYNTQGYKLDQPANTKSVEISLYVPSTWETTGRKMAGFWATTYDASNVLSGYPIIEFTSVGGMGHFRGYNSFDGTWIDFPTTNFTYDAFNTLQIQVLPSGEFKYSVNDYTFTTTINGVDGSKTIGNVILQGYNNNPGVTYDIYWDDLNTTATTVSNINFTAKTSSGFAMNVVNSNPTSVNFNFIAGDNLLFSNYSALNDPNNCIRINSKITGASGNVTYAGNPVALSSAAGDEAGLASAFLNFNYGPYGLNSGISGTLTQLLTPYIDINGNNVYDPAVDVSGIQLTLNYLVKGKGVHNTTRGTNFLTIQSAIDDALTQNGDAITVDAGTYNEQVVINKSITLKGAQSGVDPRPSASSTRTIGGAAESIIVALRNQKVISITADNVVIDGFEITQVGGAGNATTIETDNVSHAGISFLNNIVMNTTASNAMRLVGGQDFLIQKNYLKDIPGEGIVLRNGNTALPVATNQKIKDNDIINQSGTGGGAIYTYGQTGMEISGNIITAKYQGIGIGADGPAYYAMSNIDVHHNEITMEMATTAIQDYGILINGQGNNISVHNNIISDASSNTGTKYALIKVSYDNLSAALSNPQNVLINNNFLSRTVNENYLAVGANVTNPIDANCNWWSTADAPTIAARISAPTGIVDYTPFLTVGTDANGTAVGFEPAPGACAGCVGGNIVTNTNTGEIFCTIQDAINDAQTLNGHTITVGAGTYPEIITVNKRLTILGPNVGLNANTPGRVPEAKITFPTGLSSYAQMMTIVADDVTIDGFNFEGKDYIDADGTSGIIGYGNNIAVKNNIVSNFNYVSVWFSSYSPDYPNPSGNGFYRSDINVQNNYIHNADIFNLPNGSVLGYGIYMQGAIGSVTGNVVKNTKGGIQLQPYNHPNTADATATVNNNTFESYVVPLWFNYSENANAKWSITNNTLTGIAAPTGSLVAEWVGLRVQNVTSVPNTLTFTGNIVSVGTANPTGRSYLFKKWGDVLVAALDLDATYAANTWKPSAVITDGTNILNPAGADVYVYSKIQNALDDAASGGFVRASDGTFVESLTFAKSVTLIGANDAESPNTGSRVTESVIMPLNGTAITGNASNITGIIKGFTFDQANSQVGDYRFVDQTNKINTLWTFENNIFQNAGSAINGNWFITGAGDGMKLTITNNLFQNNLPSNGISVRTTGGYDLDIQNNVWENNGYTAMNLNSAHGVIKGNIFRDTRPVNFSAPGYSFDQFQSGILMSDPGFDLNILENEFYSVHYGVVFYADVAGPINVKNNLFTGSYVSSIRASNAEATLSNLNGVVVTNNSFINYAGVGKNITNVRTDNALLTTTCNWFGSTDPVVVQSQVTANVGVLPFLTDGTDNSTDIGFQPVPNSCNGNGPVRLYTDNTLGTLISSYFKIQDAINAASSGNTIVADAGTYAENIIVDKSLDIRGPNYNTSGCDTRVAEAIVVPSTSAINTGEIFHVAASNVSIKGFTIDGDNTAITSGFTSTNGADMDAAEGVTVYETGINNLTVSNNIIKNLAYYGVTLYDYPAGVPSSGHVISNNLIKDLGTYDATSGIDLFGGGVLLYNNQYAAVTNNCMINVRLGLQTGNFSKANPGSTASQIISGNTITARRRGIFHNLFYGSASAYTLSNNTVTSLPDANEGYWDGILISSMAVPSNATGNIIDGTSVLSYPNPTSGINVWNVKGATPAVISGGTITGVANGVFVNNYDGYPSTGSNAGDGAYATLTGTAIINSTTGIRVKDNILSAHAVVSLNIGTGVSITGGTDGLIIENASAVVTNLSDLTFSGQINKYITLLNNANNLDATTATFDGSTGAIATLSQNFGIEDKINHKIDLLTLGFVTIKAGEDFVTPNSYVSPNTIAKVQRGVEAASNGFIVNVAAGTYNEQVSVTKSLTILGPNEAISPNSGSRVPEAILVNLPAGRAFSIYSGNTDVIIRGFKFDGGSPIHDGNDVSNPNTSDVTFSKNLVVNANAIYAGNNTSWADLIIIDNKFQDINASPTASAMQVSYTSTTTITDNSFSNINYAAMAIDATPTVTISGNTIDGTGAQAIQLAGAIGNATVINNKINDANRTLQAADRGAIRLYGSGFTGAVSITNNAITGGYNGITVKTGENITGKNITVNSNSITGLAGGKAIYHGGTGMLSASCNWYGTTLPSAVAAQIFGPVTYVPYLTDATDADPVVVGFQPLVQCAACTGLATASISGTATVAQNAPTAPNITFTGSGGTGPYTFTYNVGYNSDTPGPTQTVSTSGGSNSVTVPQSNAVLGTYTYMLLGVTEANGCSGTLGTTNNLATITVVAGLPDLTPVLQVTPQTITTSAQTNLRIRVLETSGYPTTGAAIVVRIPKSNKFLFTWNSTLTSTSQGPVNNSEWTFSQTLTNYVFTLNNPTITSFSSKYFGIIGIYSANGANSTENVTATIVSGSGGESNTDNNVDSKSVQLFN